MPDCYTTTVLVVQQTVVLSTVFCTLGVPYLRYVCSSGLLPEAHGRRGYVIVRAGLSVVVITVIELGQPDWCFLA